MRDARNLKWRRGVEGLCDEIDQADGGMYTNACVRPDERPPSTPIRPTSKYQMFQYWYIRAQAWVGVQHCVLFGSMKKFI